MLNVTGIFGAPRSGTSWLGQIFNSASTVAYRFQPLFSYTYKARLSECSSENDIKAFYEDILNTNDEFVLQTKTINGSIMPQFVKSAIKHLVWKEVRYHYVVENILQKTRTKIIGLVRHPCAVISSWISSPREFNAEWNFNNEWLDARQKNMNKKEEYYGYSKWKQIAFAYINYEKKFPGQFKIIRYEDLNDNTQPIVKSIFDFCEIEWETQVESFVKESKNYNDRDVYGVFRKNKASSDWVDKCPPEIKNVIFNDPDFFSLNEYFQWKM